MQDTTANFCVSYRSQFKLMQIKSEKDVGYAAFWNHIAGHFKIPADQEVFLYVVPNDYSNHVRLCNRMYAALFDSAKKVGPKNKIQVRVVTPDCFIFEDDSMPQIGSTTTGQQPLSLPCPNQRTYNNSTGRGGHQSRGQRNYANQQTGNNAQNQPASTGQALGSHKASTNMSQVSNTVSDPSLTMSSFVSVPARSKWADKIDEFHKIWLTSPELNCTIETNYALPCAFELRGKDQYSISLIFKNTGSENITKDFSLSKIIGNGSPESFSLPLIKPQVQRTIAITLNFDTDEEFSYWAMRRTGGSDQRVFGTIVQVVILKLQSKLIIKTLDYTEATKLLQTHYMSS